MNVILCKGRTAQYLAKYFHAACFSPTSKTLINAIKINHFVSWPGLTAYLVWNKLPLSIPTAKVNLKQEKQGLQSTKTLSETQNDDTSDNLYPSSPTPNDRTHNVVYSAISANEKAYMDLTVRFPYCSSRVNEYFLISYRYNENEIVLVIPLQFQFKSSSAAKTWQAVNITKAWKYLHKKYVPQE